MVTWVELGERERHKYTHKVIYDCWDPGGLAWCPPKSVTRHVTI